MLRSAVSWKLKIFAQYSHNESFVLFFTILNEMKLSVADAFNVALRAGESIDSNNRFRKLPDDVGAEMCFGWVSREMPEVFGAFVKRRISLF